MDPIAEWTAKHREGDCGGDRAECPHCMTIIESNPGYGSEPYKVVENRRNLAVFRAAGTTGNLIVPDPEVDARERRMREAVGWRQEDLPENERPKRAEVVPFVAEEIEERDLVAFTSQLAPERIPHWVLQLQAIQQSAQKLIGFLEFEWAARGNGRAWQAPDGTWYDFKGQARGGFSAIDALIGSFAAAGIPVGQIAGAVSGLRVSDLEKIADTAKGDVLRCEECTRVYTLGPAPEEHAKACSGTLEARPLGEFLHFLIRSHRSYAVGPKHFTKREQGGRRGHARD